MLTIYTDKIKAACLQAGPVILIRQEHRNDYGLRISDANALELLKE